MLMDNKKVRCRRIKSIVRQESFREQQEVVAASQKKYQMLHM